MNQRLLKLLLISSYFITFFSLNAQKRLRNKEIYNFEVGDIIHFSHQSTFNNISSHTKRVFVSKYYSSNQDSVTFIVLDSIYELISIPNFKLSIKSDTIRYVNLDSFPSPYISDSLNDDCGTPINLANYTIKRPGIPYKEFYRDKYVEGLGRYFLYEIESDNTRYEYISLKYYKTKNRECGQRIGNLSTDQINYFKKIEIFPNPLTNTMSIRNVLYGQYKIYDLIGNLIQKGEIKEEIIISNLKSGVYFVLIFNETNIYTQKVIKF